MIHPNGEWFADVIVRASVVMILVAIVFSECGGRFCDESLSGVLDVVAAVNDGVFDVVPIPAFLIETEHFVDDSPGFEGTVCQEGWITFSNVELEIESVCESIRLYDQ